MKVSARAIFAGACVLLLGGVQGFLLYFEQQSYFDAGFRKKPLETATSKDDPLASKLRYEAASLEADLGAMGLEGKALTEAVRRAGMKRDRVVDLVGASSDPRVIQDLCPGDGASPARYTALRYVLEDNGARRAVVDFDKVGNLERQDWVGAETDVLEFFEAMELPAGQRVPEATLLGVGAVVLKRGEDALKRQSHWRRNEPSWDAVVEENAGVDVTVAQALGASWLLVEVARSTPGFCTQ